ncbi:Ubiquitin-conjugating enzyme E2 4 [Eumeta japonica]|uniref:E2 ubiquitin-conjugating enzyme n=1 Tax=Eumeta variegata TaxID=151549 RepID=A0A4C1U8N0_EUMVA|nr:Ubiquitin-conjugating enzyme E2 4 [Eumeta japonica]
MSTIRPEFYDFIKKLEENDDKLGPDCNPEQNLEFEYNNAACHICNGYYGPSFGEPVCVTCHAFLFPDFPSYLPSSYYISEKTDDGDSGNDEPSDLTYMNADRKTNRATLLPWLWNQNSIENEVSPEEVEVFGAPSFAWVGASSEGEGIWPVRPPPPPPPSLARNLQALSIPRPPDNLAPGLVEQLPAEVLLCIFSYLDDLSLAACACVCARWRRLVRAQVPPTRWAHYVAHRWPLFRPIVLLPTFDWQKMYQTLVDACFCRLCLLQMCTQAQPAGEASHWRRNRLRSELKMMRTDPAEGIAAIPLDTKCCHWQASVAGPVGSPYEGGIFFLYIQVPYTYPLSPPVVRFLTRILHPNVSRHGDVGIDSVQHNWSIAFTISKVLISIQSLLTDPYTAVCMEPEVGALYRESRARFERAARQWTWRYAMLDVIHPLAAASRPLPTPSSPHLSQMPV